MAEMGPRGLAPTRRRAALDVVAVAATMGVLVAASTWLHGTTRSGGVGLAIAQAVAGGLLLLAVVVLLAWRDRDRRFSLGLGGGVPWTRTLGVGLVGALATYLVGGMVALGFVLVSAASSGGSTAVSGTIAEKTEALTALSTIPLWAVAPMALFAGVYEEIVFRGFLLRRALAFFGGAGRGSLIGAVVLSASLFAVGHAYQGALGVAQTFAAGACLAVLASRAGSVLPCIVAHVAIDAFSLVTLRIVRPLLEQAAAGG